MLRPAAGFEPLEPRGHAFLQALTVAHGIRPTAGARPAPPRTSGLAGASVERRGAIDRPAGRRAGGGTPSRVRGSWPRTPSRSPRKRWRGLAITACTSQSAAANMPHTDRSLGRMDGLTAAAPGDGAAGEGWATVARRRRGGRRRRRGRAPPAAVEPLAWAKACTGDSRSRKITRTRRMKKSDLSRDVETRRAAGRSQCARHDRVATTAQSAPTVMTVAHSNEPEAGTIARRATPAPAPMRRSAAPSPRSAAPRRRGADSAGRRRHDANGDPGSWPARQSPR